MAKTRKTVSDVQETKKAASAKSKQSGEILDFSKKKKKKRQSNKAASSSAFGTSRGIESMFRNSYRANLDMIALAATKANIMISVNGSLLALLTLSSAYILTNEPRLMIPAMIFLLSCVISIFFAVLAARPQKTQASNARLDDFRAGRADLLVFEHFAQLSKEDHMTAMMELMQDKERIYTAMVAHLYFIGRSANRRFKLLRVSYSAFFSGLIVSLIAFAVVGLQLIPDTVV